MARRNRILFVRAALWAGALLLLLPAAGLADDSATILLRAAARYREGIYPLAARLYELALEKEPAYGSAMLHYRVGLCWLRSGDPERAVSQFAVAMELGAPHDLQMRLDALRKQARAKLEGRWAFGRAAATLGRAWRQCLKQEWEIGVKETDRAFGAKPGPAVLQDLALMRFGLALRFVRHKQPDDSLATLDAFKPGAKVPILVQMRLLLLSLLSRADLRAKRYDQSLASLEKAKGLMPAVRVKTPLALVHYGRGMKHLLKKRFGKAAEDFTEVERLHGPEFIAYYLGLAQWSTGEKGRDAAKARLKVAEARGADPSFRQGAVEVLAAIGRFERRLTRLVEEEKTSRQTAARLTTQEAGLRGEVEGYGAQVSELPGKIQRLDVERQGLNTRLAKDAGRLSEAGAPLDAAEGGRIVFRDPETERLKAAKGLAAALARMRGDLPSDAKVKARYARMQSDAKRLAAVTREAGQLRKRLEEARRKLPAARVQLANAAQSLRRAKAELDARRKALDYWRKGSPPVTEALGKALAAIQRKPMALPAKIGKGDFWSLQERDIVMSWGGGGSYAFFDEKGALHVVKVPPMEHGVETLMRAAPKAPAAPPRAGGVEVLDVGPSSAGPRFTEVRNLTSLESACVPDKVGQDALATLDPGRLAPPASRDVEVLRAREALWRKTRALALAPWKKAPLEPDPARLWPPSDAAAPKPPALDRFAVSALIASPELQGPIARTPRGWVWAGDGSALVDAGTRPAERVAVGPAGEVYGSREHAVMALAAKTWVPLFRLIGIEAGEVGIAHGAQSNSLWVWGPLLGGGARTWLLALMDTRGRFLRAYESSDEIHAVADGGPDALFVATVSNVARLTRSGARAVVALKRTGPIRSLCADSAGRFYFACGKGVFVLEPGESRARQIADKPGALALAPERLLVWRGAAGKKPGTGLASEAIRVKAPRSQHPERDRLLRLLWAVRGGTAAAGALLDTAEAFRRRGEYDEACAALYAWRRVAGRAPKEWPAEVRFVGELVEQYLFAWARASHYDTITSDGAYMPVSPVGSGGDAKPDYRPVRDKSAPK